MSELDLLYGTTTRKALPSTAVETAKSQLSATDIHDIKTKVLMTGIE